MKTLENWHENKYDSFLEMHILLDIIFRSSCTSTMITNCMTFVGWTYLKENSARFARFADLARDNLR